MAKDIQRLNAGQAPSLLQADKGNELIDAINNLRKSKSTANANASGFILKVNAEGALEFDLTQATANALETAEEIATSGVSAPRGTMDLLVIQGGTPTVIKVGLF